MDRTIKTGIETLLASLAGAVSGTFASYINHVQSTGEWSQIREMIEQNQQNKEYALVGAAVGASAMLLYHLGKYLVKGKSPQRASASS